MTLKINMILQCVAFDGCALPLNQLHRTCLVLHCILVMYLVVYTARGRQLDIQFWPLIESLYREAPFCHLQAPLSGAHILCSAVSVELIYSALLCQSSSYTEQLFSSWALELTRVQWEAELFDPVSCSKCRIRQNSTIGLSTQDSQSSLPYKMCTVTAAQVLSTWVSQELCVALRGEAFKPFILVAGH